MIWFLIWFILLGICIWAMKKFWAKEGYGEDLYCMTGMLLFFMGLVIIIISFITTFKNITVDSCLEKNKKNIVIYEEKYENVKNLIIEKISSYPLEKGLIKSFNPKILLSLPEIKSDKIVISMIEQLISIQDDIYKIKVDSNEIQMYKDIAIKYKWYIPAFIYPSK